MNLTGFLDHGIQDIADTFGRFYLGNRRGLTFVLRMAKDIAKSAKTRATYEKAGTHIPPFLIASVAAQCNLHCPGCYARANGGCGSEAAAQEMQAEDWRRVFREAAEIGVSFILLAGGEPLMRRDIIEMAAHEQGIVFPVFTNGTLFDEDTTALFEQHRNLIPVLSIEGDEAQTDARRGSGVAAQVEGAMERLHARGMLYGASITVTTENMARVTEPDFINPLREKGCGVVFFVEYVPAEEGTDHLVLSPEDIQTLKARVRCLTEDKRNKGISFLSFPGDEDQMGGCLAAGRGFFHINANGAAEPCPFSPYSHMNLKQQTLLEVIRSPFFGKIRELTAAEALNHKGGCTLFQHRDEVEAALSAVE